MIRLAFSNRDSQEIERRHNVPPFREVIRGSGEIYKSFVPPKAKKVSTLRGPAQLADLQKTLCAPALYPYTSTPPPHTVNPDRFDVYSVLEAETGATLNFHSHF